MILDASSGMGRTKAIAYAAVKEVIENDILVDYHTNHKDREYDSASSDWNGWTEGYGAFTYSITEIPNVIEYINNQKEPHKKVSFIEEYRQWLIEMGVSPNEPYFPKNG